VKDGQMRVIYDRGDVPVDEDDSVVVGGFNDIGADPSGRIWAGVQRMTPDGAYGAGLVVLVTGEHAANVMSSGVVPNGNAVSPDGERLYQIDSTGHRVMVFDLRVPAPVQSQEFTTEMLPGHPDGCAVAADGSLWIAFHHGGCVGRFDHDGKLLDRIEFPTPTVTSLCFGAAESHELFVVTDDDTDSTEPQGCIYRLDVGVAGAPVHPARL
jgi:sugar lactone lactonase YvrE